MPTTRKRFSVSLEADDHKRLQQLADSQRPKLTRRYLVELAVSRLLDDATRPGFLLASWGPKAGPTEAPPP